jgi:small subunit ribosomal protein S6
VLQKSNITHGIITRICKRNIKHVADDESSLASNTKISDAILRHLTIRTKRAVSTPSPMMKDEKSKSLLEVREPAPVQAAEQPAA